MARSLDEAGEPRRIASGDPGVEAATGALGTGRTIAAHDAGGCVDPRESHHEVIGIDVGFHPDACFLRDIP